MFFEEASFSTRSPAPCLKTNVPSRSVSARRGMAIPAQKRAMVYKNRSRFPTLRSTLPIPSLHPVTLGVKNRLRSCPQALGNRCFFAILEDEKATGRKLRFFTLANTHTRPLPTGDGLPLDNCSAGVQLKRTALSKINAGCWHSVLVCNDSC